MENNFVAAMREQEARDLAAGAGASSVSPGWHAAQAQHNAAVAQALVGQQGGDNDTSSSSSSSASSRSGIALRLNSKQKLYC